MVAKGLPEGMTAAEARARGLAWTGSNPDNVGPRHRNKFSWLDRLRAYRLCGGDYRAWGYPRPWLGWGWPRPGTWPEVAEIYRFLRAEIAERIAEAKAGKVAPLPLLKV